MQPNLQHFRILMPPSTHRDAASCRDVDCTHYLEGWMTVVGVGSEQEDYIRRLSGRKFRVEQTSETIITFIFEPGQRCFHSDEHTVLNGREPHYLHESAAGRRVHTPTGFMEHAHEQLDKTVGLREER